MTTQEIKETLLTYAEQAVDQRIAAGVDVGPRGEAVANVLMGMDMVAKVLSSRPAPCTAAQISEGIASFHRDMDNIRNRGHQ